MPYSGPSHPYNSTALFQMAVEVHKQTRFSDYSDPTLSVSINDVRVEVMRSGETVFICDDSDCVAVPASAINNLIDVLLAAELVIMTETGSEE